MANTVDCSIVVPVYNAEACLRELSSRIHNECSLVNYSYELIFVNDGSEDGSWDLIKNLAGENERITGINLRKNFGQDNAIMAGIRKACGEFIVIMDDDLQHDPMFIPELICTINKGFDVVYANYSQVKLQHWWKNVGSWVNGKVAELVLHKPAGFYLSPYKIIRKPIARELCDYHGAYPYIDGLLFRITHKIGQIRIKHRERFAGQSAYTLIKSILVWSNLVTNFSIFPLRIATFVGLISALTGFILAVVFFINKFIDPTLPIGWTSVFFSVQVFGGIQLFAIGVLGEYIGKTYLSINRHPQYSISEIVHVQKESDTAGRETA